MRDPMTAPIYGLTSAQADCARVIHALTDFLGNSPSYAEAGVELGLASVSGVHRLVHGLIERGWIEAGPKASRFSVFDIRRKRSLRLTRSPPPFNGSAVAITEAGRAYLEQAA